jgi:hypothetical protein
VLPVRPSSGIGRSRPAVEAAPMIEVSASQLNEQYEYVKRDLIRIAVIAAAMFGLIIVSRILQPV